MSLVTMKEIMVPARAGGYAVGAFEVWNMESTQAAIAAAEKVNQPIILQIGPATAKNFAPNLSAKGLVRSIPVRTPAKTIAAMRPNCSALSPASAAKAFSNVVRYTGGKFIETARHIIAP